MAEQRPYPLEGVRVIDFTEYVAGPYGTMLLADMGAEVIKVEPWEGDHWRRQQPVAPFESRAYIGVNRAKRSIALRLDDPEGQAVVRDLIASADVVVVNFRRGGAAKRGLSYTDVAAIRPDVIYCENTAFGDGGPYADRPGFDILVQALSGIMDYERKLSRGVPLGVGAFAPADLSSGMFMAYAVVSALFMRERTGLGQHIETSLFASALAIQYRPLLAIEPIDREDRETGLATVAAAREQGMTYEEILGLRTGLGLLRAAALYYRVFPTKDSLICVACLNNRQRRGLRDALGVEDASVDGAIFEAVPSRTVDEHEAMLARFEEAFRERTTDEWLERLAADDVPCTPVVLTDEVYDHEQVAANGLMYELEHPVVGTIRQPASPIRMSNASTGVPRPSPAISADAHAILAAIGYDEARIAELEAKGAVRPAASPRPPEQ